MSPCSLTLLVASFCTLFCSQLKKINSFNSWYSLDFHFLVLCFTNSWSTYQNKMEDLTKGAMWRYINTHWLFDSNCRVDRISWTHNIIDTLLPCPSLGIIYVCLGIKKYIVGLIIKYSSDPETLAVSIVHVVFICVYIITVNTLHRIMLKLLLWLVSLSLTSFCFLYVLLRLFTLFQCGYLVYMCILYLLF